MSERFAHGYALLIGVDQNSVAAWALPDVAKDVGALAGVLADPQRCAYPPENVKVIQGREANRLGILDGLDWLRDRLQADASGNATAVVYYTGHGWRDDAVAPPAYYLIPYDVRPSQVRFTALQAPDLAAAIDELDPQRLLVVLDCCHAAGMGVKEAASLPAGYAEAAVPPLLLMDEARTLAGPAGKGLEALAVGCGRAVLSSSSGEQPSYMRPDGQMSVFTYHLIEALTGHAQPAEGATEVLVSDVMGHVYRHVPQTVRRELGQEQMPDFRVSGNYPIALLLGGKGLGVGQPPPAPLARAAAEADWAPVPRIDTGSGAYIGGWVDNRGGTFVGRDQVVGGDQVYGDKVAGDKIVTGPVSGAQVAVGRGPRQAAYQETGGADVVRAFAAILARVDALPEGADRDDARETVEKLQEEADKGPQAEEGRVRRLLHFLAETAPEAWEVAVETFVHPIRGLSLAFKKVAERAKAERETGQR
jgi:hypothetical protein